MKSSLWLLCWLLLPGTRLRAQPYAARTLSIEHGLPEYFVSGLYQDKAGFVWVATRDGLARYDGRQFKAFRYLPFKKGSLNSNIILSLKAVSDTTLLLHLEDGSVQLFNPVTERFTDLLTPEQLQKRRVRLAQVTLTTDNSSVWGRMEKQLIHFDRRTNTTSIYPLPDLPDAGKHFSGNSLSQVSVGRLYAIVPGHLIQFDTRNKTFVSWPNPKLGLPGQIDTYYGTSIIRQSSGELLITAAGSLITFDPRSHQFRTIPIPGDINTHAGIIYEAPDKIVYFTYGMTVYSLTPDKKITPIWTAPRTDYQNYFHALLLDRSGVLWIGTNGDGIQQIDLKALPVKTYPYQGTFLEEILTRELRLGSVPDWARTNRDIFQVRMDGKGPYIAIGVDGGYELLRGDQRKGILRSLLKLPVTHVVPGIAGGNGLRVLSDGTIWMYNPHKGLLKTDSTGKLLVTFPVSVPINMVSSIQPIGDWIWLGSEESGLYGYDLKTQRMARHLQYQASDSTSLPSNRVQCMVADPINPNQLWVGTQDGLACLDIRTMRFRNSGESQQLPSSTIQTLLIDRHKNLWFSTFKGISRLNPRTGQMRHFSTADGLLDIEYRHNHAVELPDGRLAFGGAIGVTVFDPQMLTEKSSPIATVLTDLRISNELVGPNLSGSPLLLPLNATTTLRLRSDQNFLSIEFAGVQYNKPGSLKYRYQLVGLDKDWVYSGNRSVANYTQLAPGSYEFRVNTADPGGHWSQLVKSLQIVVAPPWWQTWWAYLIYGIFVAGLIRTYIQYRVHDTQLQQDVKLKEQEALLLKENSDWQTRFFTNITHEFRTPLTLIINPLERLMSQPLPATTQQQYGIMHRNARRLLRLINQLLDIAKLEAGQLAVTESRGNLNTFFAELVDSFRLRAERKHIDLRFQSGGIASDALFDVQKLETIGYNLLANALKFTPEAGQILVELNDVQEEGKAFFQIQVSDSGQGIESEQLPRIFDRFFQGKQNEGHAGTGTGIGLFLVAEFTKLLGGRIQVQSQPGQGTTFTLTIPLRTSSSEQVAGVQLPPPAKMILASKEHTIEIQSEPVSLSPVAPLLLIVEDNDELREFISQELSGRYRVLTANNGQEGWKLCLSELPELVISDVMMPLMDGFALVENIKTTPLTAHIAVILLTAKTMTESRIQGLSKGANDYLTKPFYAQELLLRVANLLKHQQQLRQFWQQRNMSAAKTILIEAKQEIEDPFLMKFYSLIDSHLDQSAFSVEHLADELAVSPRTLLRKLTTLTGSNPNELMRIYRLQKAAQFLREGCTVSEAAEKSGFEGLSYFSKLFKAQFSVLPSAYPQTLKN